MNKKDLGTIVKVAIGAATGFCLYKIGQKKGWNQMTEALINIYENGDNKMVVTDKNNLLYEISAECIGD